MNKTIIDEIRQQNPVLVTQYDFNGENMGEFVEWDNGTCTTRSWIDPLADELREQGKMKSESTQVTFYLNRFSRNMKVVSKHVGSYRQPHLFNSDFCVELVEDGLKIIKNRDESRGHILDLLSEIITAIKVIRG